MNRLLELPEGMVDAHFHAAAMKQKGVDVDEVLRACEAARFSTLLDAGTEPDDLSGRYELLSAHPQVLLAAGASPHHAESPDWQGVVSRLRREIEKHRDKRPDSRIVAMGEIGLDWHWNYGTRHAQMGLMEAQLDLAVELGLPVIIHNREADVEVIGLLTKVHPPGRGMMHCFSSGWQTAKRCLDLGMMISFAGNVTYKGSSELQEVARKVPSEYLLVETDSPYLAPVPHRGRVNSPPLIQHTYAFLAELRDVPLGDLVAQVTRNLSALLQR